jgi:glutamate synthase domain-containing protein 3
MVELEECTANDLEKIRILLRAHFNYTSSNLALDILNEWYDLSKHFLKVMPTEYKKALLRESLISATLPV